MIMNYISANIYIIASYFGPRLAYLDEPKLLYLCLHSLVGEDLSSRGMTIEVDFLFGEIRGVEREKRLVVVTARVALG